MVTSDLISAANLNKLCSESSLSPGQSNASVSHWSVATISFISSFNFCVTQLLISPETKMLECKGHKICAVALLFRYSETKWSHDSRLLNQES